MTRDERLPAVIAAIRALGEGVGTHCTRLSELCFNNPIHKELAFRMGGFEALLSVVAHSNGTVEDAIPALKAMRTICGLSKELKEAAGKIGCISAAVKIMGGGMVVAQKTSPELRAALVSESCWLLASLLANHDANIARAKNAGALDAVKVCIASGNSQQRGKCMFLSALLQ